MEITKKLVAKNKRKQLPKDESTIGFGKFFTDHMFLLDFQNGEWKDARITPFSDLSLSPAAVVLHYGQEIFEGMKAFRQEDGGVSLFRPEKNAERMIQSAKRMAMEPVPKDYFLESLHELISLEKRFVPKSKGTALYIRPTEIATEAFLGVRSAKEYLYYVILCSVGPYFSEGFKPIKIFVETEYIRAAIGGTGEAKTGGNYAASLLGLINARNAGCKQVMWLDAQEHKFIEEVGTMNQFFVIDDTIVTPALSGTILEGITRESVIQLAKDNGYQVEERPITIDEVVESVKSGKLTEAFGSGTAASIAPVGELVYKGKKFVINNNKVGAITKKLYELITGIQYGRIEDPYGWNVRIKE